MYRRVDNLEFVGYTNSNLNGCPNDRRSTSGYIFMMDGGVISWNSKKQFLVASFTMQAEFITCFSTVTHVVWFFEYVVMIMLFKLSLVLQEGSADEA